MLHLYYSPLQEKSHGAARYRASCGRVVVVTEVVENTALGPACAAATKVGEAQSYRDFLGLVESVHLYYSPTQEKHSGCALYKTSTGEIVKVTAVSKLEGAHGVNFPDIRKVGMAHSIKDLVETQREQADLFD